MDIGGKKIIVIAGPCAVESEKQCLTIAEGVKKYGATMFRGGVFKPRSSPFSFQGLGEEGIKYLQRVREFMPVVSEATQIGHLQLIAENVDILQIGARNMHNVELLTAAGKMGIPILLKRGFAADIREEWIPAAEYVTINGNNNIIFCERGIKTFETYTRSTLDISAVAAIKQLTNFPVMVDPSHAAGRPEIIESLCLAAIAAGADGLIVEVHNDPKNAICDGHQAITIEQFGELMKKLKPVAFAVGRTI